MSPKWTEPLDLTAISPPISTSPTSRHNPLSHDHTHTVPILNPADRHVVQNTSHTRQARIARVRRAHPLLTHLLRHPRSTDRAEVPRHTGLQPVRSTNVPRFVASANKPVSVPPARYAIVPDPVDEHDYSFCAFSTITHNGTCGSRTQRPTQRQHRRNVKFCAEHCNNSATRPSRDIRVTTASAARSVLTQKPHGRRKFSERAIHDIFEGHVGELGECVDGSLSSFTDSRSLSHASQASFKLHGSDAPPGDNCPRRIAFADLSNTLDLSPCASSEDVVHPDHRDAPDVSQLPDMLSSSVIFPESMMRVGRKKSFAVSTCGSRNLAEGACFKSLANDEALPTHSADHTSVKRLANAECPRKNRVTRYVRVYRAGM